MVESFPGVLKKIVRQTGCTQAVLAAKLGVTSSYICKIGTTEIASDSFLRRFSQVFGLPQTELERLLDLASEARVQKQTERRLQFRRTLDQARMKQQDLVSPPPVLLTSLADELTKTAKILEQQIERESRILKEIKTLLENIEVGKEKENASH